MIGLQVVDGQHRPGVASDARDDVLGDRALQQRAGAVGGQGPKRRRVGGVLQDVASLVPPAVGLGEIGLDVRRAGLWQGELGLRLQPRADGETIGGQGLGPGEQGLPGQAAVLFVRQAQHGDGPRRTGGTAAQDGVEEGHRPPVRTKEELRVGRRRSRLAAVVGGQLAGLAVEVEQEAAAAEARTLRLDQAEHGLHRHGRVDGVSAAGEHLAASLRGQGIGRHHHAVGIDALRPGLGLGRGCGGQAERRRRQDPDQEGAHGLV